MNANDWRRLAKLFDRSCPDGIDTLEWRRCQEAVRAETQGACAPVFHTATGQAWPHEGATPAYPPTDPRDYY